MLYKISGHGPKKSESLLRKEEEKFTWLEYNKDRDWIDHKKHLTLEGGAEFKLTGRFFFITYSSDTLNKLAHTN